MYFLRLLRLSHSPAQCEGGSEGDNPHEFPILDFRFSIIGAKSHTSHPGFTMHLFSPESKIGNLKSKMSFYDSVRSRQHIRRNLPILDFRFWMVRHGSPQVLDCPVIG
jgi:hypothetical protein